MTAMLDATLAGTFMPLGGLRARIERIRPFWLENELRHGSLAFGAGLMAAVLLVLVPEGQRCLSAWSALPAFGAGGITFFLVDRMIERRGGGFAQLIAMLLNFVPDLLALEATLAAEWGDGIAAGRVDRLAEPAGRLQRLLGTSDAKHANLGTDTWCFARWWCLDHFRLGSDLAICAKRVVPWAR